jgi:ankyrin repeat protein
VQVTVLRRCKAQLDVSFLRQVLRRPVDQGQVDAVIRLLDEALSEHSAAPQEPAAAPVVGAGASSKSGVRYLVLAERVAVKLAEMGWCKHELTSLIEMERQRTSLAKLTKEELIAVRLYTGPPFMKFNTVLRMCGGSLPESMTEHLCGNKYVTSIHTCVSGIIKLSTVSCIPAARVVYRGMTGMRLPTKFWVANQWGARGGVELAFLSTTTKREIAIQYIGTGKAVPTIFEIEVGMIDKGGSVSFLSQFPGEDEILMPPRSNIEVTGTPRLVATDKGQVLVIPARINANLKVKTIEETQAQRKNLHMSLVQNVVREVKRDVRDLQSSTKFRERTEMDATKSSVGHMVESVIEECEKLLQMHDDKSTDWFNTDSNYDKILGEAISLKSHAMGKLKYWLENKEVWAQDHGKRTLLQCSRLSYGKLLAAFWDCKESGDTAGAQALAKQMCQREGFMVEASDEVDDNGEMPLHAAAANGIVRAVRLLLDAGADTDLLDDEGNNALMLACSGGIFEVAQVLLDAGTDPNASNYGGCTAVKLAAEFGHVRCIQRLIKAQADVNQADNCSYTPLMWATQNAHLDCMKFLLEHNADVDSSCPDGWTALFDACQSCALEPARVLVEAGINVNAKRRSGAMPLFMACQQGPKDYCDLVELLLVNKAEVDGDMDRDRVPLIVAAEKGRLGVVRLLLEHGARAQGHSGTAAYEVALENGHEEVCTILLGANACPPDEVPHDRDFAEGTRVRCRYSSSGHWYTATIAQKNDDGTYTVAWDDGDQEDKIKAAKDIRFDK